MNIYDLKATTIEGSEISLSEYKDKVILIVNTASKCGFTPQFEGLEEIYKKHKDEGLIILGFPCNQFREQDPGDNQEIQNFCQLKYGVSFQMFQKIDVNGINRHPVYSYLIENSPKGKGKNIKWNFEKFLINREGTIINRFSSITTPGKIEKKILKML